jgi:dolichol kinase
MAILCIPLGYILLGWVGVAGAIFATLIERWDGIDDNLTVPLGSAALMTLLVLV